MALTQVQIIQSLGEAMNWLERELGWGVPATEQRHLIGRIGELYAALITNGQLAPEVNQRGYDVVSKEGERISVKTTAKRDSGGHLAFNSGTLGQVDRVMILYMNTEEMQIEVLLDEPIENAKARMSADKQGKLILSTDKLRPRRAVNLESQKVVHEVHHRDFTLRELESGTMLLFKAGIAVSPAKPCLREIAGEVGVGLLNGAGNPYNTRQLGSLIIRRLIEESPRTAADAG
jgi:hypothetical protein